MKVKLDNDNYPVAWGEQIDGRDIPAPPDPPQHHRWDEGLAEWVRDDRPGRQSNREIRERLQNNQISVRDALMEVLQ